MSICDADERLPLNHLYRRYFKIPTVPSSFQFALTLSLLAESNVVKKAQANGIVIPPLQRHEIEEIITYPAAQSMIVIQSDPATPAEDKKFINGIINEALQSAGSLPLLAFAMQEWYNWSALVNDGPLV